MWKWIIVIAVIVGGIVFANGKWIDIPIIPNIGASDADRSCELPFERTVWEIPSGSTPNIDGNLETSEWAGVFVDEKNLYFKTMCAVSTESKCQPTDEVCYTDSDGHNHCSVNCLEYNDELSCEGVGCKWGGCITCLYERELGNVYGNSLESFFTIYAKHDVNNLYIGLFFDDKTYQPYTLTDIPVSGFPGNYIHYSDTFYIAINDRIFSAKFQKDGSYMQGPECVGWTVKSYNEDEFDFAYTYQNGYYIELKLPLPKNGKLKITYVNADGSAKDGWGKTNLPDYEWHAQYPQMYVWEHDWDDKSGWQPYELV